jgi:hypothetical protein
MYDLPGLPQYDLPELRGERGRGIEGLNEIEGLKLIQGLRYSGI